MALIIEDDKIAILIPNSEAGINAQHFGIKDRTVGMYYLSEMYYEVSNFLSLNSEDSKYYIDFVKSYTNAKELYDALKSRNLNQAFKTNLEYMRVTLESVKKQINSGNDLLLVEKPTVNEQKKYIKFKVENAYFSCLRDLCLGDLTKIIIQRLSKNCFRIYMESIDNLNDLIYNGTVKSWCGNQ